MEDTTIVGPKTRPAYKAECWYCAKVFDGSAPMVMFRIMRHKCWQGQRDDPRHRDYQGLFSMSRGN